MTEMGSSYRPKVLVVEDDPFVLNLLDNVLTSNNYEVFRANNGRIALEVMRKIVPDVIVSDIMMPEMNGYELLRHVQSNDRTRNIPFLFLSAKSEISDRVEGLRIGADDYMSKPFAIEELIARIEARLSRQASLISTMSPRPRSMQGDLSVMSVVDLIQLLRFGKKTGEIVFHVSNGTGIVRMNEGDIVDISIKELEGDRAFRCLLEYDQGWFSFTLRDEPFPVKFIVDTQYLIVDSVKQIDDYRRLLGELPDLNALYRSSLTAMSRTIPGGLMDVLVLFENGATIREVMRHAADDEMTTATKILHLFRDGYLEVTSGPATHANQRMSILNLPDKYHDQLIDLLRTESGIPSIILIALGSMTATTVLERFCGAVEEQDLKEFQTMKKLLFKKVFIDGCYEINFYAINELNQFDFLHHIISENILGVFLAAVTPANLLHESVAHFVKDIQNSNIPLVTIQSTDKAPSTNDHRMQARLVREYPDTVHHCRIKCDDDFLPVIDHWLRQIAKIRSARKTR